MVSTWDKFDGHICHGFPVICKMYYGSDLLLCKCKVHCLKTFEPMGAHWAIKVYVFVKFQTVDVCCGLKTFNSVVSMLVMGLVLGPSLTVISITGILL